MEENKEKSIINCNNCGEIKERFLDGRYPGLKDKRWVSIDGKQFNGHTCPDCHSAKVAQRKRLRNKNRYV